MATITRPGFSGHVGTAHFDGGTATSDDPDVLAYCEEHPAFTVHPPEDEAPAESPYDELTDEELAEAYDTNVAGNARKRQARINALDALDNDPALLADVIQLDDHRTDEG